MLFSFPQSLPDFVECLIRHVRHQDILTYFKKLSLVSVSEHSIVFGVGSSFAAKALNKKFVLAVVDTLADLWCSQSEVSFVVDDWELHDLLVYIDHQNDVHEEESSLEVPSQEKKGFVDPPKTKDISPNEVETLSRRTLNPRYQLENYVVGPSNQLAFAAADAVSRRPGQSYNPLFIYGGVGLGKTHLLQAIGNATKNRFADKHVVYTTADKFLSDYVDSVKRRNTDNLRDRYAAIDVLIIDDIQFLARKTQTQEELYNIFNILYDAKKQIVLSGDRAPRELEELEPRLKSRFESGIIVDVAIPDYETKLAIIQGKISERGFRVEKEVLEYIAFHAGENIRELEGILNQIVAQYELTAVPPTLDNVAKLLNRHSVTQVRIGSTLVEPVSKVRSYEDLLDHVAKHFWLEAKHLISQNRQKQYMIPRQIAMYLLKNRMHYTLERIGNIFGGRNHSAVLYSCKKLETMLKKDQNLHYEVNVIRDKLWL